MQLPPNEEIIESTHEATLPTDGVNQFVKEAIFLISLVPRYFPLDNCATTIAPQFFTKKDMEVVKDDKIILEGTGNLSDDLWDVPIQTSLPSTEKVDAIVNKNQTKEKLAQYYHSCCFSLCISTFAKTVKNGNFISWPGLQDLILYCNMKRIIPTFMSSLDQGHQGLQSTKSKA